MSSILYFGTKIEGEQEIQQQQVREQDDESAGLVAEDSNEFGLTQRDYDFIQEDIAYQIAKFDEEHGYDGTGWYDEHGNYFYPLSKVNKLNQRRKSRESIIQEVAITKGIIKIHYPVIEPRAVKETEL